MPTNLRPQGITLTSSLAYPRASDLIQHNQHLLRAQVPGTSQKEPWEGARGGRGRKATTTALKMLTVHGNTDSHKTQLAVPRLHQLVLMPPVGRKILPPHSQNLLDRSSLHIL